MGVFNWIRADFADGPDFVSDAPDELTAAIARALAMQPDEPGRCGFGLFRIETARGSSACGYMRFSASPSPSGTYVHAIVLDPGAPEPILPKLEALFHARYGNPPEASVGELVGRLARQSIAQTTLSLTELFVTPGEVEQHEYPKKTSRTKQKPSGRPRASSSNLPWLLTTLAVAFAAFMAGRLPSLSPAPVADSSPSGSDLEERVARLEEDRGVAGMPLREQLKHERRQHQLTLEGRDIELRELATRLDALRSRPEAAPSSRAVVEEEVSVLPSVAARGPVTPPPVSNEAKTPPPVEGQNTIEIDYPVTVLAELLWVRNGPGVDYPRISALIGGSEVALAGRTEQDWVEISGPVQGWVASEFLDLPVVETIPAQNETTADSDARVSEESSPTG